MIEWFNYERCDHCSTCYDLCPMDLFDRVGRMITISHPEEYMTCFLREPYT